MIPLIGCQVSLYPLGTDRYEQRIRSALEALEQSPVRVEVGPMSTFLWGKEDDIWLAVQALFRAASQGGASTVLTLTVSNACSVPEA